jgi:hypothetical protein
VAEKSGAEGCMSHEAWWVVVETVAVLTFAGFLLWRFTR